VNTMPMSPSRPYLLRAFYQWIVDNHCTPYLVANGHHAEAVVPHEFMDDDGSVILDLAERAAHKLVMNNSVVEFDARFNNKLMHITVPIAAVVGIYANETGQGTVFGEDEYDGDGGDDGPAVADTAGDKSGKSKLRLIK